VGRTCQYLWVECACGLSLQVLEGDDSCPRRFEGVAKGVAIDHFPMHVPVRAQSYECDSGCGDGVGNRDLTGKIAAGAGDVSWSSTGVLR